MTTPDFASQTLSFLDLPFTVRLLWVLLGAAALYLLPGFALQHLLLPQHSQHLSGAERCGFALALGVAGPPLLLFAARVLGATWGSVSTWVYVGASASAVLILAIRRWRISGGWLWPQLSWQGAALGALLLAALVARLYSVRDLPAGLWGDSYHHTVVAQLLIENGGLFTSWQPYAPLTTFTYHFGFHANAAFLHWLTGIPVLQSVVQTGQVLNASTVLMAYLLTTRLLKTPTAGVWAALLTGFVNLQPAYFVNWGRYTQLAGQVILPAALLAWSALLRPNTLRNPRLIALTALLTTGLALTHYLVTLMAALCVGVLFLARLGRVSVRQAVPLLGAAALVVGCVGLLLSPWLANALGGYLGRNAAVLVSGPRDIVQHAITTALPPITPTYIKPYALALAALGAWLCWQRQHWAGLLLAAWAGCLLLIIVPNVVGLPGNGIVDLLTGYIGLYVFVLPLAGYGIAGLFEMVAAGRLRLPLKWLSKVQLALITATAAWGLTWQPHVADVQFQLLTLADVRAMQWIRANTTSQAHFLVMGFPAYGGSLIAGSDGGWWLPFLTGRPSTLPPLMYGTEKGVSDRAEIADNTVRVWRKLRQRPNNDLSPVAIDLTQPSAIALLRQAQVSYVYFGAHSNPSPQTADSVVESSLRQSNQFRLMYEEGNVRIFQLVQ